MSPGRFLRGPRLSPGEEGGGSGVGLRVNTVLNPFTAPACKIPGLTDARTQKQCVFRSHNTSAFSATRLDENPFTYANAKNKKA